MPPARLGSGRPSAAPGNDDGELLVRAHAGDERAIALLYRTHAAYIASIAHRLLQSDADVDDVVQETFMLALRELHTLREPGALRVGWAASP